MTISSQSEFLNFSIVILQSFLYRIGPRLTYWPESPGTYHWSSDS